MIDEADFRPPGPGPAMRLRARHAVRGLHLALCTMLAACAHVESQVSSALAVEIPAGWSVTDAAGAGAAANDDNALAEWWQRFHDAGLDDLVQAALRANTSLQGAISALQQAQALRDVAAAALWPTLNTTASAQRGMAGGRSTGNSFQVGLDAQWVVDLAGARRAAVDAGEAGVAASQAGLSDVQTQIAAEIGLNYILLRSSQVRAAIARDNLASQEETLQITLWRQQAGLLTALEAEQAQAAVEQNRAVLPALQTAIAQTQHALAVLTGLAPAALPGLAVPGITAATVPQVEGDLAPDVPAQVLRRRPDVRAAEYQVAAALARVGQAQAQRWPSFAIGGSLGLGGATVAALGGTGAAVGSLLASLTLPVFDGGALRAQVRVQQAALGQARQSYRAAILGALQQVEDALVALRGDRLRMASLQRAAGAAGNAAQLARQRYGSGLVDFQTVLETQRTLYATQDGVATASADVSSDHVRLYKALGGGWLPVAGTSTP